MSEQRTPAQNDAFDGASAFDELIGNAVGRAGAPAPGGEATASFATAFRGYDKDEVDAAMSVLNARLRGETELVAQLEERYRRAGDTAETQSRQALERLEAELADIESKNRETVERLEAELAEATAKSQDSSDGLEADLAAANARLADAEQKVQTLTEELLGASVESPNRHQFEEVLQVAEEQASLLIKNATVQGDRLLEAAREEIQNRRNEAKAEAASIVSQAQHDAQKARLRIETELTAHRSGIEREAAHAAEKVSQAEQEAAAIRSEAEKGAAALRSMVARETEHARAEAEEAVRELRVRALEFEESLTRRQDDAQQEFLVLHNQAVAHAERITQDANEQVAASLEHAQRVGSKADDFEKLMRAQAQQIEADANVRSREQLDRASVKAQRIIDTITAHSQSVLRDAEDRTRQLRWQQHQLTSFMSEVKELIRPEGPLGDEDAAEPESAEELATESADADADTERDAE